MATTATAPGLPEIEQARARLDGVARVTPVYRSETLARLVGCEVHLKAGDMVRVIRQPFFGRIGKVTSLPPELMPLETEAKVRVLEVDFGSQGRTLLPRANVEMIES